MPKITIDLTERQLSQLIQSLKNDWMDNSTVACGIIDRILEKIKEAVNGRNKTA